MATKSIWEFWAAASHPTRKAYSAICFPSGMWARVPAAETFSSVSGLCSFYCNQNIYLNQEGHQFWLYYVRGTIDALGPTSRVRMTKVWRDKHEFGGSFFKCTDFNSTTRVAVYAECAYVFLSKACPRRWMPCWLFTNTAVTSAVTNCRCHKLIAKSKKIKNSDMENFIWNQCRKNSLF